MDNEELINEAYARYDSDPRVHGIDDMDAFRDAVRPLLGDEKEEQEWQGALKKEGFNTRWELLDLFQVRTERLNALERTYIETVQANNTLTAQLKLYLPVTTNTNVKDEGVVPDGSVWSGEEGRWVHPAAPQPMVFWVRTMFKDVWHLGRKEGGAGFTTKCGTWLAVGVVNQWFRQDDVEATIPTPACDRCQQD